MTARAGGSPFPFARSRFPLPAFPFPRPVPDGLPPDCTPQRTSPLGLSRAQSEKVRSRVTRKEPEHSRSDAMTP